MGKIQSTLYIVLLCWHEAASGPDRGRVVSIVFVRRIKMSLIRLPLPYSYTEISTFVFHNFIPLESPSSFMDLIVEPMRDAKYSMSFSLPDIVSMPRQIVLGLFITLSVNTTRSIACSESV